MRSYLLATFTVALSFCLFATPGSGASADLWQARNGTPDSPNDPVEWVKGNAGAANSHFVEGYSIPYRIVMTGLTTGYHNLVIEWDIKQGGKPAVDYLTHYDRLLPHNQFFDHAKAEAIQPLDGVAGDFGASNTFPIPPPSTLDSPVPGQPATSFNSLPADKRVLTIWNGTITNVAYTEESSLTNEAASTQMTIEFIATNSTVVIAWGGHIASQMDWGAGNSAVSINGSPYHTRKISLDGGGGNQDRSLQAQAVIAPFSCDIAGPAAICPGSLNTYQALTDATNSTKTYRWALTNNTSGAAIVGATNSSSVQVRAGGNGSYTVQVIIGVGGGSSTCSSDTAVVDTMPPVITCSSNLTIDCASPALFSAAASDDCDTNVPVVCTPPSGSVFALGVHTVTCTATDLSGNSNQCQFTITIQDVAPPQITTCPADKTVAENPADSGSAVATFATPAGTDNCDANVLVNCLPPSGSAFPVGVNTVTCTATDAAGNTNACSFTVRVIAHELTANSTNDSGPGSLRQALLDANDSPSPNLIVFDFPGSGPHTINLLSPLPALTDELFIDGWSQPGFSGTPSIVLNGAGISPAADGLAITGSNSTIRGLALYGFANAIRLEGAGNNVIQGNYIGTDSSGSNPLGNLANGILIQSPGNLIGGILPEEANRIVFNGSNGVSIEASAATANALRRNVIYANGQLGIDLGGNGVTLNDTGDGDTGPNQYQNFPILTSAHSFDRMTTTIEGTINSAANSVLQIEFFATDASDGTGFGEGQRFLGATTVTTDANGNKDFLVTFPFLALANYVTATATDESNNSSEFSEAVRLKSPPIITQQPVGTNAPLGASVTLCVTAIGSEPLFYQWRKNGANVPDATNACLTIENLELTDGGSYRVIVANEYGFVTSEPADLLLALPTLQAADNFADRVALTGTNGLVASGNSFASQEPGEPLHAGKIGGKSVWYTWEAPVTGIATFATKGSTFDTLLAVYTGTSFANLVPVASDEDLGGFFTSGVRFNAIVGTQYHIAIDGFGGSSGEFFFGWEEEDTPHLLALIRGHPISQTVSAGEDVTFAVDAVRVCGHGHQDCPDPSEYPGGRVPLITYQWFLNGQAIEGATNETHTVFNVQPDAVGNYTVQVTVQYQTQSRTIESLPASLQINLTGEAVQNVQATDKFLDTANAFQPVVLGGGSVLPGFVAASVLPGDGISGESIAASTVVRGYTGSQVFSTAGSATEVGEEPICGVMGGASQWISFVALESGTLHLNTEGSSYDTVVAVFVRSPTNATRLQLVRCDNNSGQDGRDSKLDVPVQAGRTNFIVIDGVNSATGILQLNYSLVTATTLTSLGVTGQGAYSLRVNGHAAMRFTIQKSTDFVNWTSILTTNSSTAIFNFTDPNSSTNVRHYYRALMLP